MEKNQFDFSIILNRNSVKQAILDTFVKTKKSC